MPQTQLDAVCVSNDQHDRAPLMENMENFRRQLRAPFYCPGHKGGRSLPIELSGSLGEFDLNNLPDTDTLHCPSGPIREAEQLLADAYGALRSFFMVGGSSLGNMAAVMSVARPGDKVLVQRNAHKSVIAGIIHCGAIPVWLSPTWDSRFGIGHGLPLETVERAIEEHRDARALVVLNPTYFGVVADLAEIARRVAETDLILVADEAHGPHFRFGTGYPPAAEDVGADIVVQSTHKILSGLSQAAALHVCSPKVDQSRVQAALQALQTTSPNFAIMVSIDLARRQMMQEGRSRLAELLALANYARAEVQAIQGMDVMGREHSLGPGSGFTTLDRTKLLIDTSKLGWSGTAAQRFLNREFGVQPELSGPGYLLCIMTLGSIEEDVQHLLRGLEALSQTCPPAYSDFSALNELAGRTTELLPEVSMSPREAFYAGQRFVTPRRAVGCISGEVITPYPPGIPVIMPGERFTDDIVDLLEAVQRSGCPISCVDPSLASVKIVAGQ
ncbi:MAG: aminotransferase class I/II-fold pyridoxal phosphate-dependent enzyme [Pirellulaceae bacterium]|nr:aminotransferase class I/II-fold pyridoxal phosphate-dependent enzyme [Pirellulaceae bacterium]